LSAAILEWKTFATWIEKPKNSGGIYCTKTQFVYRWNSSLINRNKIRCWLRLKKRLDYFSSAEQPGLR
jgi:hypothetical protein